MLYHVDGTDQSAFGRLVLWLTLHPPFVITPSFGGCVQDVPGLNTCSPLDAGAGQMQKELSAKIKQKGFDCPQGQVVYMTQLRVIKKHMFVHTMC